MSDARYAQSVEHVLTALGTSREGISSSEARMRMARDGKNELPREKPLTMGFLFFRQFTSPLIIVLLVAMFVSAMLGEWVDAGVIGAAILLNTIIGFVQEVKATHALDQLQSMVRSHALVRRGGKEVRVESTEIVVGDILMLSAGDRIPADARLIEAVELQTIEAALTGESEPVSKTGKQLSEDVPLAERANMVFTGTSVGNGRGKAVVTAIGIHTELGKIAALVKETKEESTPLQAQLRILAKRIAVGVLAIIILLFVLGLYKGIEIFSLFELSIALAVSAVPEGLVVGVTIILAIGMQRVLKRKALVRRLLAAETLGSVSVVCADKTGTITQGIMRVHEIVPYSGPVLGEDMHQATSPRESVLALELAMLCNNAMVDTASAAQTPRVTGSPTEQALMLAGLQAGIDLDELKTRRQRIAEIPFTSERKYMATLNVWDQKNAIVLMGAPERILDRCGRALAQGGDLPVTDDGRAAFVQSAENMANRGLRVLAIAYKPTSNQQGVLQEADLENLIFVGFIGLRDPLREGVRLDIRAMRRAGVRTVIITGDHPNTARAIAREAGVLRENATTVATGSELDAWTDEQLKKQVQRIHVFARVEPRHKIRIVRAFQELGETVAMTGDGVNDAPALKAADIGVAVGSGTEVAKQASDMILLDNNIGTIAAAIEEGRIVFDNIRKTTVYLITDSFVEIILILGAMLMGLPIPLTAIQILWLNIVKDSFPNVGLTLEPGEAGIMDLPPRRRGEPVLNNELYFMIFFIGIMTSLVLLLLYRWFILQGFDINTTKTIIFLTIGFSSLFYVFAIKTMRKSIFRSNPFSNGWLLLGALIGAGMMLLAMFLPWLRDLFGLSALGLSQWGLSITLGLIPLAAVEMMKEAFLIRKKYRPI